MAWKELIFLVLFLASFLQVECRLDHEHEHDEALIASGNVTTAVNCSHPVDIAFIVDASGSISAKDYQLQKEFIKKVAEVNQLKAKGAHFGVVLFSDTSSVAIKFNEFFDVDEFKDGVQRMKHEFSITRIDKGLKTAYDQLFTKGYGSRYDVPRVAFLLTDGQQTRRGDFIEPYIAAIPLKEIGIKLIAIGIGSGARRGELETITGDANAVFMVRNYKRLVDKAMIGQFNYACRPEILQSFATTEAPTTTSPTANPSTRLSTAPAKTTSAPLAPLIDFYVLIDVTNNRREDVKFKWMQDGEFMEEIFKSKTKRLKSIKISSRRYPLPIVFQAFDAKTNELIQIRDRANLLLIPRTRKITEKLQFDPKTKEAYINLRVRNMMKDNVTLIWQQQGKRESILLPKESSLSPEVVFDRSFGIGPVSFRGFTANDKKHPVKLNGKLDKTITPTIVKQVTPLLITKAVRDYQISLNVVNRAIGPVEVKWEEDGKPQVLQVPFQGRAQREILLKDKLKAKPIAFSAFLKGTKDSASLDGRSPLYVWPLTFRRVKNVVADKKFYIDFRVTNQVAEDIIVKWKENGVEKSLVVKPGTRGRQNRVFSGPSAKDPVTFTAVTKETNATVKLDGLDVVEVVPRIRRIWTSWTAKMKYYLDLKVENRAADDIEVFWTERGKQKSIEVVKGKDIIKEMVFEGPDARKKIEFGAVVKGTDHVVKLNGRDQVAFESTPEKKLNVVKAGRKYFLDVEFSNDVAGDIIVSWNENNKAKSLSILRGSSDKVSIVSDGPEAKNAVRFAAVIKGTDVPVDLNGKRIVTFFPSAVPKTRSVFASKTFVLDVEIDNQAPDAIAVRWQEDGAEKTKDIQPGDKGKIGMFSNGVRADDPVQFDAVIKGADQVVPLDGKSSIEFTPSPKKETKKAVASLYKLQLINKVSGDITATLNIGQNSQSIKVPYKGTKETYIDFDSVASAVKLTGINDRNQRKVNVNGSVDFEVVKDEKNKVIIVILENKICDMKVDVIFVIDASGSILPKQYQHQKNFVKKLVDLNAMSKDGLHAGVVLFSQTSSVAIKLNDFFDSKAFAAAVQKVKHECSITRIDKGLKTAYDKLLSKSYGAREGVPKVLFLVTDGKQTRKYNFIEPRVASMPLKKAGVNIKAIGIGRSVDRKEMETITGNKETVYLIRYFNQLVDKKFFETFDFNCDPRNIQPFTSPPGIDPAKVPDEDIGPPKDYFVALDVANKLNKPVVVKWKEDGKPKQVDIAKKSKKNVDIKIRKPYFPNPVTFNAVEKDSGKAATLQGRKELDVYPRTEKVVEKIEILPDSGSAYLSFDVKNELDEPIVVKWQQDGETKSLSVPAKTTEAKELVFDLAKPGALSPKIFKGFTKDGNQPVNINAKKMLTFTPSVEKKKETIVVSPNTEDSYTIIYVINNAKEDVEVAWKRGDINHVIRVPHGDKRYHEIVFDKRKGEVPLTFIAHSYAKGKDYKYALNGSATHTFSPTLAKKVNTLVIGGELKAVDVNFVNNADGPVVISWLENSREQTQSLKKGEKMKRTILRAAEDAAKKLVFAARRSDADIGVKLNDDTSAVFDPSVDTSGKTIVATDIQAYIDINVNNQVAGDIIVKWKENGLEKSSDVKRGKDASNGIVITGPAVKDPVKFTAVMKETNDKVKLNDLDAVEIVPQLSRKAKADPIVASKNFFLDVEIDNQAPDAIAVRWEEDGTEKTKDVQSGDKRKIGMVFTGVSADDPVQFDAVIKGTNQEVPLDGRSSVEFTPSPKKETKKAVASIYKLRLINKVSGNVTTRLEIGPDLQNLKVPYKGSKETYINFDGSSNAMKLSGVNDRNQRKVNFNGSVVFEVVRDEKNKVITVILENKICDMKVDVIFVIDASGSILPKQYQHQKNFVKKLVDLNAMSKDGLHAGVVLFSQTSSVAIKLNDFFDSKAFAAAVQKVKHECSITRIDKGLKTAYDKLLSKSYGAREGVPKVLFLVTDGKQRRKYNFIEPRVVSMPLKKAGVNIKAIGIGRSVDRKELEAITGNTETVYLIRYFNQLVDKKFFETFDFNCDPRQIQPFKLLPGLEPSPVPDRKDIGPPKDYFVALDVANKLNKPVVVKWKEDGKPKQVDIAKKSNKNVDIKIRKPFFPNPVTFNAVEKDSGKAVSLRGRKELDVYPRTDKVIEKIELLPDDGSAYLSFDVKNELDEPIVVKWQQDGETKSLSVPAKTTEAKELVFDLAKPGALSPKIFKGFTKKGNQPVNINAKKMLTLTPSVEKKKESIVVSPNTEDSYTIIYVINNAKEDVEVAWKRGDINHVIRVPHGDKRYHEIVFDRRKGEVPLTFTAHSHGRGKDFKIALNSSDSHTFSPSMTKKINTLIVGGKLKSADIRFVNNAEGPVIISWLEKGRDKTIQLGAGETIAKSIMRTGEDATKRLVFTARRTDIDMGVRLNDDTAAEYVPSVDTSGKTIVATDIPRYVVAEFRNEAFSPVEVSWFEKGKKKTLEVQPTKTAGIEISLVSMAALEPLEIKGKYKRYDEPVRMNGLQSISVTPTVDKVKQSVVIQDEPKYIIVDLINKATVPVSFVWKEKGTEKFITVKPGDKKRQEIHLLGQDAYAPLKITAKRTGTVSPVNVNNGTEVSFTPSLSKHLNAVIATNKPRYIVVDLTSNAAGPIVVSWEQDGEKKTREVKPGETVQEELVFIDGDPKRQVTFTAVRKDNNEPVKLNGAENVKFTVTPDKKPQKAAASDMPRYIVADFTNNAAGPIVVSWEQDGEKKTREVKPGETVQEELVFIDGDPKRQVTFTAVRKDNNEPVKLNGADNVKFTVTPDKKPQKAAASDMPRYIVADFTNNAAGPIVISWEQDGEKKTREVKPGETVQQELVFTDGDPKRQVTFTAVRKDNNEPVKLNGAENVKFKVTPDKKPQRAAASDMPRYIVADFTNNAAGPIVVSWEQDGEKKTREVKPGETVQEELVFIDGDPKRQVTFTAVRKDNNEPVKLNGAENVKFTVTPDKKPQKAVASDMPRYIVADFTNNAASPIVVSWEQDGEKKTREVKPGETVQEELVFIDGDPKRQVTFTAVRKDNNEPVKLNGAENVKFTVTPDKKPQKAAASDMPRYIVADFTNNAAGPIVVSWEQDGEKKTREVKPGETVQEELVFIDGDPKRQVTFTAVRKDNNEPVKLNGAENVKFKVTPDKKPQRAAASDMPRYIVADFTNNAAGPIVVSWEQDGEKKTREVKPGETVQEELVFIDGDPKRQVTFTAVRKDNNEPVKLNGAENVKFKVTPDKKPQRAAASDMPRYIVADFTNNAAGPIVVSWEQDGEKKTREVKPGETVQEELVFIDGDPKRQVTFTAVRKDNNEPVRLNGAENVKFTVTSDKKPQKAAASDMPRYIVADFTNNAAGPIVVSWEQDGEKKTREVKPGETVQQELVFINGDPKRQVTFTAVRKDNNEPVKLNGAENVKFTVTSDKKPQKAAASDMPRYIVADFTNNAAGPIVVSWEQDGEKKTREVKPGETVQEELVFIDGDPKREVTFTAVRKDNNEPVKLNGADNVKFTVTPDKKPQRAAASDMPRYIVADFTNNAAGPIVVSWEQDGEKKTREVKPGETVQQELVFIDGDPKRQVTFTAVRKDNNEPVRLNGAENVKFTVTSDKKPQKAAASDMPRYIVADFTNNAAGPIVVSWEQDGEKKTREVKPGETVQQELVFINGDPKRQVTFTAVRKDNNEPVKLNGADNVKFTVTSDKKPQKAAASDMPRYIVADFTNNAAGPIVVSWEQDGEKKTREVKPGETVQQELVFINGDPKRQVTFTAVRKDNNEPVKLNGADNVKFTVTSDKKPQKAAASDMPRYIVADFTNNAAGPIVVSWEQDGEKKTREVKPGETVQQELVFIDGDPKRQVTFTAVRKDNNEPVKLNGAENVKFTVTPDKKAQRAAASDMPRYIVADFTNNAAGPIVVSWEQDGEKKTREVKPGETVQEELVFIDGDPKRQVTFTAVRKDNNEPVKLNGADNVKFTVTPDKKAQRAAASDMPRYIVADFTNNAAGPIVVSWEQDGEKKTREVKSGETVQQELVFIDGDPKRQVTFTAVRKDNNKAVKLNNADNVTFRVTGDKTTQKAVATNPKLYVMVEFINQAAGPVDVSWSISGVKRYLSVPLGKTLREELVFNDGLYSRQVVFSGSRRKSGYAVRLNNLDKASIPVRSDQSVRSVILTDYPRYVSVDIANNADSAILVSWLEGGSNRTLVIEPSRSAQREIVFKNADVSSSVTFSGKLKDSDQPISLNGLPSVTVLPTATKAVSEIIATNVPVTINIEFVNKALGPVVFSWLENGVPKMLDVEMNGSKRKAITLNGLAAEMPLVFTGRRKYFDFSVKVNNAESVQYIALVDKGNQRIVASDQMPLIPFFDEGWKSAADVGTRRYLIVDVINKANGPIRFTSSRGGQEKNVEVANGETKRVALVFQGLDDTKPVLFYGKRSDFGFPIRVNDAKTVELKPRLDKTKVDKIVVTAERLVMPWLQPGGLIRPGQITSPGDMRYVTVDLVNNAKGPIVISTSQGSRKKEFSLSPGGTTKTTFVLNGGNEKPVLFVGRRTDTNAPVSLNYEQEVLFVPRKEQVTETLIARDQPKYVAVDFINDAGGPVTISWVLDGRKGSLELAPKKSTLKQLSPSFKTEKVVFTAVRTDTGVPVKLNKADSVTFIPRYDRSIETVTATDTPQYIVVDLVNKADGPAEFSWIENGQTITHIVGNGQTVQKTITFKYVTGKKQVSFTAKRQDLNFPILVNNANSIDIVASFEKIVKQIVATDIKLILPWFDEGWKSVTDVGIRRYLEVDITNKAFGPIVVTAARGSVKKTVEIAAGKTSSVAMIFQGPRSADPVTFKATRKDTGAVVHLNDAASVQFSPRFERFTENIVAIDAPKYLSVDITNNAFGPITVSWLQNGVQMSAEVRPGKTVRRDMVFKGANADKPISFTGVISGTRDTITLNDASNAQFSPSYDRTVKSIVAKSRDVSRYLVIDFNNQGSGPGVVSWVENGGTQRSLDIPQGQTLRRELVFNNGDAFKKITFTAKRKDSNDPMRLNDVREFQLVPSAKKNPQRIVLTDSPRYLDILFRNNAPGSVYISWLQNGVKKQLTVQKGQSIPLSLVLPAQEGNMPFVFSATFVSLPGIVYLNNLSPISYVPSFVKSQPHTVTATSPHVDVNFINNAQRPATVKWIELENPKQLTIPAGQAVRRLIFFDSPKDATALTGSLESNGKKFVAQLNTVDSLRMQEDAANLRRNVQITEGKSIYFFGLNVINKMDIDARIQYRFNGNNAAIYTLTVPAKSTRRRFVEYGKEERVTVGAERADTSKRVYVNNNEFMMYRSVATQVYNDVVITQEPDYQLELKIINKLPQDTTLYYILHGNRREINVPSSSTVAKVIRYKHTDHPFDFRAFVKGTKALAKVNSKRSLIYSHRNVPKQVLELIIDSEHYLGIQVVNIRRSDSLLLWNELGVNKSLAVGPRSGARKMIVIHRAGPQDPIEFTAVDRLTRKPLPVNRKQVVSFRPSLRKKYEFIRILAYKDPNTFYVMYDVRNRARDNAIILWSVNGVEKTRDCPLLRRCSIFIRFRDPTGNPKPVQFRAIVKANGKALTLNKQSFMNVQPLRYQKIVNAVIENKEEITDTRVVNVDASSMQQSPMIIRFSYNGQTGSFRLDGFANKKYEIVIKNPKPTTKVVFTAIDAQTGEATKINEKESDTHSTKAFKSNMLLLAGGKVVVPGQVKELVPTVHECQDRHVDVLFMIDNSGTMEFAFKLARLFAKKIMALFRLSDIGTRASVITIAGLEDTNLVIRFSDFYEQDLFNTAIDRLRFASGKTRIDKALDIATNDAFKVENGGRPSYPKLIFFISDGRQVPSVVNGRYVNLMRRSYQLRRLASNIVSIAIHGERPVDIGSLQMISWKRENVYNPGRLEDIVKDIFVKHIFNKYCKV